MNEKKSTIRKMVEKITQRNITNFIYTLLLYIFIILETFNVLNNCGTTKQVILDKVDDETYNENEIVERYFTGTTNDNQNKYIIITKDRKVLDYTTTKQLENKEYKYSILINNDKEQYQTLFTKNLLLTKICYDNNNIMCYKTITLSNMTTLVLLFELFLMLLFVIKHFYRQDLEQEKVETYTIIAYATLLALICVRSFTICTNAQPTLTKSYVEFLQDVDNNAIETIYYSANANLQVEYKNGFTFIVTNPNYDTFKQEMLLKGIEIKPFAIGFLTYVSVILNLVVSIMPLLLFMLIAYTITRGVTNTHFKLISPEQGIKFDDIAGMTTIKEEVRFAVDTIVQKEKLIEMGLKPVHGILLYGPPGTGKTMLAKAIAGESGVPFIHICGSDFVELYVGNGAKKVRQLFEEAQKIGKCVIFIDELDAIGGTRRDTTNTEYTQTINCLLSYLDGMNSYDDVFVIGATNKAENLDEALVRPGRFDKKIYVGLPETKEDRIAIMKHYLENKTLKENFDYEKASKFLIDCSGADIEEIINEAGLLSIRNGENGVISEKLIDDASIKLALEGGLDSRNSSQRDLQISALHESGHALMSLLVQGKEVPRVTILGTTTGAGGITWITEKEENECLKIEEEYEQELLISLGGLASEELLLGTHTHGPSVDLEEATFIAIAMAGKFAMSSSLLSNDVLAYELKLADNNEQVVSDAKAIVENAYYDTKKILKAHKKELLALTNKLLQEETIYDLTYEKIKGYVKENIDLLTVDKEIKEEIKLYKKLKTTCNTKKEKETKKKDTKKETKKKDTKKDTKKKKDTKTKKSK